MTPATAGKGKFPRNANLRRPKGKDEQSHGDDRSEDVKMELVESHNTQERYQITECLKQAKQLLVRKQHMLNLILMVNLWQQNPMLKMSWMLNLMLNMSWMLNLLQKYLV